MDRPAVISFREAARVLGCDRRTITDLVRASGIRAEQHPSNARALALTPEHVAHLRLLLTTRFPARQRAS